jgi:hypothetical protein
MENGIGALSGKTFLMMWLAALIATFALLYSQGKLDFPITSAPPAKARAAKVKQPTLLSPSSLSTPAPGSQARSLELLDLTPVAGAPAAVAVFKRMDPKAAGTIVETLTEEDAAFILTSLKSREASHILENLAPETASRFVTSLVQAARAAEAAAQAAVGEDSAGQPSQVGASA